MTRMYLLAVLAVLAVQPAPAGAQTQKFLEWDQAGATLVEVQSYTYELTSNGTLSTILSSVTCTGTASPYVCRVATSTVLFPEGRQTVTLTAHPPGAGGIPSGPSAPLTVTRGATPGSPRIRG